MDYSNDKISKANNKEIYSSTVEEQRSKVADVENLKKAGLKGEELITEIVANNSSMAKRTLLSQEKILKRMEVRHKYQICLAKPSIFNLTETLFLDKINSKIILHMRFDTICTIMQKCKFMQQSKSLIYDLSNGFLTSVLATRATGTIYSLYEQRPYQRMIAYFNLSAEQKSIISYFEYKKFLDSLLEPENLFGFNGAFTNLIVCVRDEFKLVELVGSLIASLKNSGNLVVYARDKEVSLYDNMIN